MISSPDTFSIIQWLLHLEDNLSLNGDLLGSTVSVGDGAGLTRFGINQRFDSDKVSLNFFTRPLPGAIQEATNFYDEYFFQYLDLDKLTYVPLAASCLSCAVNLGRHGFQLIEDEMKKVSPSYALVGGTESDLNLFIQKWCDHYQAIVATNPSDEKFLKGWLRRANLIYPQRRTW